MEWRSRDPGHAAWVQAVKELLGGLKARRAGQGGASWQPVVMRRKHRAALGCCMPRKPARGMAAAGGPVRSLTPHRRACRPSVPVTSPPALSGMPRASPPPSLRLLQRQQVAQQQQQQQQEPQQERPQLQRRPRRLPAPRRRRRRRRRLAASRRTKRPRRRRRRQLAALAATPWRRCLLTSAKAPQLPLG